MKYFIFIASAIGTVVGLILCVLSLSDFPNFDPGSMALAIVVLFVNSVALLISLLLIAHRDDDLEL